MADQAPCRSCGTMLLRSEHRRLVDVTTVHDRLWDRQDERMERRSYSRPVYENIACPNCGDASPLLNNKLQLTLFFLVFFAIVGGLLAILFFA